MKIHSRTSTWVVVFGAAIVLAVIASLTSPVVDADAAPPAAPTHPTVLAAPSSDGPTAAGPHPSSDWESLFRRLDSQPPIPAPAGDVTILFGRAIWEMRERCGELEDVVDLGRVAQDLADRGLSATGAVVPSRVAESTRDCWAGHAAHASWDDLAMLRDTYGWRMISNGYTHDDPTLMTPTEQVRETCGSLEPLREHGHDRGWGLFAYGNNRFSLELQRDLVSDCFAYGRTYAQGINQRAKTRAPWFQMTNSVLGGMCNEPSEACYQVEVPNDRRYWLPSRVTDLMSPFDDEWSVAQFYRLVEGTKTSGEFRWDCTADDPRLHWTNRGEIYCYRDFLTAVDNIPRNVRVTDPATVAEDWGRTPPDLG